MLGANPTNHSKPQFADTLCFDSNAVVVIPKPLRLDKINAVLLPVRFAFGRIKLELHG